MEAYKKTALYLHSLNDIDRQWLIEKLQPDQQKRLIPMLEELNTLGIPRQMDLVNEVSEPALEEIPNDSPSVPVEDAPSETIGRISNADPVILSRILKDESPITLAAILLVYEWPWRQSVLDVLGDQARQAVSESMTRMAGKITDKTNQAMVDILSEKLDHPHESEPADGNDKEYNGRTGRSWFFFRRRKWQK